MRIHHLAIVVVALALTLSVCDGRRMFGKALGGLNVGAAAKSALGAGKNVANGGGGDAALKGGLDTAKALFGAKGPTASTPATPPPPVQSTPATPPPQASAPAPPAPQASAPAPTGDGAPTQNVDPQATAAVEDGGPSPPGTPVPTGPVGPITQQPVSPQHNQGDATANQAKVRVLSPLPQNPKPFKAEAELGKLKACPLDENKIKKFGSLGNAKGHYAIEFTIKKASVETELSTAKDEVGQKAESLGVSTNQLTVTDIQQAGGPPDHRGAVDQKANPTLLEEDLSVGMLRRRSSDEGSSGSGDGSGSGSSKPAAKSSPATSSSAASEDAFSKGDFEKSPSCLSCMIAFDYLMASSNQLESPDILQWLGKYEQKAQNDTVLAGSFYVAKALQAVDAVETWKLGRLLSVFDTIPSGLVPNAQTFFCKEMSCCSDEDPDIEAKNPDFNAIEETLKQGVEGKLQQYREYADYEAEAAL